MFKTNSLALFLFILYACNTKGDLNNTSRSNNLISTQTTTTQKPYKVYKKETSVASVFAKENNLSDSLYFLLDFTKHSGKSRFYVIEFNSGNKIDSGLVSHGCGVHSWGSDETKDSVRFSNEHDSHLSSYGKYRVGNRGISQWGINVNYKLHGLDSCNSNAYGRIIVLHSWDMVSEEEIYPNGAPEGWGCPAVSNGFMLRLDKIIDGIDKGVLMWVLKE